jgi:PAS domain S-box-containing protein
MDVELAHRFWEEAPDAAIAVSADGRIVFCNNAAEVTFGYHPCEALDAGCSQWMIKPADTRSLVPELLVLCAARSPP